MIQTLKKPGRKFTLALIAHDAKKEEMIAFASLHRDLLSRFRLVTTGTTGKLVAQHTGLKVYRCMSGPLGGDQIGFGST